MARQQRRWMCCGLVVLYLVNVGASALLRSSSLVDKIEEESMGFEALQTLTTLAQPNTGTSTTKDTSAISWAQLLDRIKLPETPPAQVDRLLKPLAEATKISYSGEFGTPVEGLRRHKAYKPKDGLHAALYITNNNSSRGLVAFRGTTSKSDKCFDNVLWVPEKPMTPECQALNHSLDYVGQAERIVTTFVKEKGIKEVLLTGHSLGCSMAQLITVLLSERFDDQTSFYAICFAPGGMQQVLERKDLKPGTFSGRLLAIANPYDPVVRFVGGQIGTVCNFQHIHETLPCRFCSPTPGKPLSVVCDVCFAETHLYKNYLDLLQDERKAPKCDTTHSGHD